MTRPTTPITADRMQQTLAAARVHPELLAPVAGRTMSVGAVELTAVLLDRGHVVEVGWPGGCIGEWVLPEGAEQPRGGRLHHAPFARGRSCDFRLRDGGRVRSDVQVERLPPPLYRKVHDDLLPRRRPDMPAGWQPLVHLYESPDGFEDGPGPEADRPALAMLDIEFRPHELLVLSWHTFPAELTILRGQTLVELPGGAARRRQTVRQLPGPVTTSRSRE